MIEIIPITYILISLLLGVVLYLLWVLQHFKKTKEQLTKASKKQATMIGNISDVIAIMDIKGQVTYKSPNIETHFGWKPEDIVGNSGFQGVHPEDQAKMQNVFGQLLSGEKEVVSAEFKYECKDGKYKDVFLYGKNMFDDPEINGVLLNYRDISVRKKAHDRLADSEVKYRTLFEQSIDIVCVIGNDGEILDVNNACVQFYGYTRTELLSKNISDLIYPEDKEKSDSYFQLLEEQGYYKMYEGRIVTKAGDVKWVQINSTKVFKDGECIGSQDVIRDVTTRKEADQKLRNLNATKDKFFSIISHDLRNPFLSLIGFTELLLSHVKSKRYAKVEQFAQIINETATHGDKLLTNLLDWTKLQQGTFKKKPDLLLLHDLIADVIHLYKANAMEKGIIIEEFEDKGLTVFADKNMTKLILRNLVSNAIKFTPNGGNIRIEACEKGSQTKVSVIDNGIGIPGDLVGNVFKLESNVSTEGTNAEKGTGLGLILCKEFVERQGGEIWVESQPDIGSTFSFTLPNKS